MKKSNTFTFHKNLQIASLDTKSDWHNLRVHTLMQNVKQKQPSINAFLGARYSRSADSVVDIASEIMKSGTDAAAKLEKIFAGYGHKSVGDMAELFVCIENVPAIIAERLFYINPVHAGQQRSTRYQDFSAPNFIKLPKRLGNLKGLRKRYNEIILKQVSDYCDLLETTRKALVDYFKIDRKNSQEEGALTARNFDTARYFLPLGIESSLGLLMSARSWADLIAYLRASTLSIERELGETLFSLLSGKGIKDKQGYVPEADGLIRHTDPNCCRNDSTEKILKLLAKDIEKSKSRTVNKDTYKNAKVTYNKDSIEALIRHYQLLANPLAKSKLKLSKRKIQQIGKIIFDEHNHYNQIGNIGQMGSIAIESMTDYGSVIRDILRHRSLERFVPLLENNVNLEAELNRESDRCFFLCDYLNIPAFKDLKQEYTKRFIENYDLIKKWHKDSKGVLDEDMRREYTRYLLPQAHATVFRYYGSVDDWQYVINLRTRNGGHIAYRMRTYKWLEKLAKMSPFWKPLLGKIPKVNFKSREQFVDRS